MADFSEVFVALARIHDGHVLEDLSRNDKQMLQIEAFKVKLGIFRERWGAMEPTVLREIVFFGGIPWVASRQGRQGVNSG